MSIRVDGTYPSSLEWRNVLQPLQDTATAMLRTAMETDGEVFPSCGLLMALKDRMAMTFNPDEIVSTRTLSGAECFLDL